MAGRDVPLREAGLTLIEILVVLAIIAVMAYLIVPNVIGRPDQARVTVAQTDMRTISAALKMYRLDNGDYPTSQQGLAALVERPTSGPEPLNWAPSGYLDASLQDPLGPRLRLPIRGRRVRNRQLGQGWRGRGRRSGCGYRTVRAIVGWPIASQCTGPSSGKSTFGKTA